MSVEYIQTKERLEEVSVANLGPMNQRSYRECAERARRTKLEKPLLVIETVLKQPSIYGMGAGSEVVYPISEPEWDDFIASAAEMAEYMPVVHVVDGKKFTAPI